MNKIRHDKTREKVQGRRTAANINQQIKATLEVAEVVTWWWKKLESAAYR